MHLFTPLSILNYFLLYSLFAPLELQSNHIFLIILGFNDQIQIHFTVLLIPILLSKTQTAGTALIIIAVIIILLVCEIRIVTFSPVLISRTDPRQFRTEPLDLKAFRTEN